MRLQTYILNEGRSKSITEEEAIDLLTTKCKKSLKIFQKQSGYIFRGVDNNNDFLYINPNNFEDRKSRNTSNEYTEMFNYILPSWKRYPKRSIICSTDYTYSRSFGYGNTFCVFPYDGANIAVCSHTDIWNSFVVNGIGVGLNDLNKKMRFLYMSKDFGTWLRSYTWDEYSESDDEYVKLPYKIEEYWSENTDKTFFEVLDFMLDPKRNGFEIVKSGDRLPKNREVWFHKEAILIEYTKTYHSFMEKI